jgi:hypothetical protein
VYVKLIEVIKLFAIKTGIHLVRGDTVQYEPNLKGSTRTSVTDLPGQRNEHKWSSFGLGG